MKLNPFVYRDPTPPVRVVVPSVYSLGDITIPSRKFRPCPRRAIIYLNNRRPRDMGKKAVVDYLYFLKYFTEECCPDLDLTSTPLGLYRSLYNIPPTRMGDVN